jgi:hypothetical protein
MSSKSSKSKKEWTGKNLYNGADTSVVKDKRISEGFKASSMFKSKE